MTKFITIVSGKGGVGKTTTTLNIGHSLTKLGKKVILLDANLVTPNLAINLGMMDPKGTINKYLRKEKGITEIIYLHESGISVIPASPAYTEYQKTNSQKLPKIFEDLDGSADFVIVDAPSGLGYDVTNLIEHSDEVLIVTNPTLSSVMDALKTIQVANAHRTVIAGVVVNMSNRGKFEMKPKEIEETLGYTIIANIRNERKIRKASYKTMPVTYIYPRSRAAKQFNNIANHLALNFPKR